MKIHQNFVILIVAAGFSFLVFSANVFLRTPDGLLRIGFAAALYLVARDTLAGANIAKGPRRFSNPDRWVFAFYLALFFGTFMMLAMWRGLEALPGLLAGIALGASLFGGLMAFLPNTKPYPYAHQFKIADSWRFGRVGQVLYYFTPPLKLLLIWILVQNSPQTPAYLFFYIILIGFGTPRYRRKANGNVLWANFPMIIGYAILAAQFFLNS